MKVTLLRTVRSFTLRMGTCIGSVTAIRADELIRCHQPKLPWHPMRIYCRCQPAVQCNVQPCSASCMCYTVLSRHCSMTPRRLHPLLLCKVSANCAPLFAPACPRLTMRATSNATGNCSRLHARASCPDWTSRVRGQSHSHAECKGATVASNVRVEAESAVLLDTRGVWCALA